MARSSEPVVLPARFPNLLVNGAGGIAVGMATNIPPHNLGEVIDAAIALIDQPELTIEELIAYVPGPDFPTGGAILGRAGIQSAYLTGRGSILTRAKVEVEELRKEREALIVTEIPYQVNKATLIEKIAELVRDKRVEGISDLRDESDRDGMRIVIELKRDAVADVVLNQLWRFTALQSSFACNMIALNGGRPEMLTLKDFLAAFIDFREEVVTRRTKHLLAKARDGAHLQVGLAIAVANIDEVIRLIRTSQDAAEARAALMARSWPARDMAPLILLIADPRHVVSEDGECRLSEAQARAILELRLQRLTALGREEIAEALNKLAAEIADYLDILQSRARLFGIIKDEMLAVKAAHATPRRTDHSRQRGRRRGRGSDPARGHGRHRLAPRLHQARSACDLSRATARRQGPRRDADAGRGFRRAAVRRLDAYAGAFLFLARPGLQGKGLAPAALGAAGARQGAGQYPAARTGRAHYDHHAIAGGRGRLGDARRHVRDDARHGPAQQALAISRRSIAPARSPCGSTMARRSSTSRSAPRTPTCCSPPPRGSASAFPSPTSGCSRGAIRWACAAFRSARATASSRSRSCATSRPTAASAPPISRCGAPSPARPRSKASAETAAETPADEAAEEAPALSLSPDRYAEMSANEQIILTLSTNGFGKRTSSFEYRITGRGGKGIVAMAVNQRNGPLVASMPVEDGDEIMLVTDGGQLIRCPVEGIRVAGRGTQGVIVFNTGEGEQVVAVERITEEDAARTEADDEPPAPQPDEA